MAIAPERMGIGIQRRFTTPGQHPYDSVVWERRDARIVNFATGAVAFEQLGVEVPSTWSLNATNILAQKYFRGTLGTPEREWSLKQVVDRVVDAITAWGRKDGYFVDDAEAETFSDELKYLIIHQKIAFNSPVWFNIGVDGVPQQGSACFILAVEDSMDSILNWYTEEGIIFKGGSGAGVNLSKIRSSKEGLRGGGTASGPVSFMRGADASAGTIKSGGKTRRAAKMVILNADHPDIEDFIWCKAIEESKARALRDAGFDMDLDGKDSYSIQYQNANNSVRVTDEFMQAVLDDADWHLRAISDGEVLETIKARDLFRQIAKAAWECADPGMQFDTTINRWHTAPNTDRINASNPCCFVGETKVVTNSGPTSIEELAHRCAFGLELPSVRTLDPATNRFIESELVKAWVAGYTQELVAVRTTSGGELRCTREHRFLTEDGDWVEAWLLIPGTQLWSLEGFDSVVSVDFVHVPTEVPVYDIEIAGTHNFGVETGEGNSVIVHNSEYMHLDNSACNLASLNLLTFLQSDGSFDIEGFKAATEVVFTGQEIIVGNADYPTEKIAENSRRFRQLGIGYANLGALLMAQGLPYDSDAGRAWAGAITALLTGHSYATSARTAARMGPFAGYQDNREPMLSVLRMHRDAAAQIDEELVPPELLSAAQESWDSAVEIAEQFGVRNSQASVLAPTGCLVAGTLVATDRGLVRIGTLGDPEGAQWQELDAQVATDEGPHRATRFYVNGLDSVVTVDTARGYRIQGTPQHRVKVVDASNGEWVWKRFSDLEADDLVPLALNQLVGEAQIVSLPPLADAYWTGEHHAEAPREMTPELAELIGYFMGDGSLHSRGLRFCITAGDDDVVARLRELSKLCFGLEAHVTAKKGYTEVRMDSVRLVMWWKACGFAKHPNPRGTGKGYEAHIPNAVLYSNDRAVYGGFLRGLFEADGDTSAGYPTLKNTSLQMVRDCQAVLLAIGLPTSLSVRHRTESSTAWGTAPLAHLRLANTSYSRRWLSEIGFISARKNLGVKLSDERQAGRRDYIPLTREMIDRLAPINDRLRRVLLMEHARGMVSRRIASELMDRTRDPELGYLLSFFFDWVATTELTGEDFTYDISVPSNVTYVANGFISHNTIGLLMDCDTTGIEPDLSLVKMKKLVGGGTMSIVNQTVPRALRQLGYTRQQVEQIIAYIDEHKSIVGAPNLSSEHFPVFACSMGDNTIHYSGHIRMMGAVQPFISGALSKTVNVPEDVTVEDVEQIHIEAWQLGLKAIAIYRDNCKVAQPLATAKKTIADPSASPAEVHDAELALKVAELEKALQRQTTVVVKQPIRERLPRKRASSTFAFRVADCEGYVTVGEYEDGRPGEVFMKVSKQGSTLSGIMDAFSIAISLGLQHGVPLATFVKKYTNMRFEPAGMTDDPDLRLAQSLMDYIFRRLAVDYLPFEERAELGVLTTAERTQQTLPGIEETVTHNLSLDAGPQLTESTSAAPTSPASMVKPAAESDAPYCFQCGVQMQRAGSCHACPSCGTTSGCS